MLAGAGSCVNPWWGCLLWESHRGDRCRPWIAHRPACDSRAGAPCVPLVAPAPTQELELYKKLSHRHVVGYVDHHFDARAYTLYIFLEYVPGGSIASMLDRFGRFSEDLVRNYTRQLLLGLEYLHSERVVHRDLKVSSSRLGDARTWRAGCRLTPAARRLQTRRGAVGAQQVRGGAGAALRAHRAGRQRAGDARRRGQAGRLWREQGLFFRHHHRRHEEHQRQRVLDGARGAAQSLVGPKLCGGKRLRRDELAWTQPGGARACCGVGAGDQEHRVQPQGRHLVARVHRD